MGWIDTLLSYTIKNSHKIPNCHRGFDSWYVSIRLRKRSEDKLLREKNLKGRKIIFKL